MAQGILQSLDPRLQVYSAGTQPASRVNPWAVEVMRNIGIDISQTTPRSVNLYLQEEWDYVITVCDHAQKSCPVFPGKVNNRLHLGFDDPAVTTGSDHALRTEFIRVRDQIIQIFTELYQKHLKSELS
jgi:arsenate reductase